MPDHVTVVNLGRLVGNTPLVALRYRYQNGPEREVFVKCEQYNLTGSIKDRVALYALQHAQEQGLIMPGDLVAAASGGNMGISYAAIGKALGYRVRIRMPENSTLETRELVRSYGATIQPDTPADPAFWPQNPAAEVHEKTTGREISHSLILDNIRPGAFVCAAGSGDTLLGIGKYLSKLYPELPLYPVEPLESRHRIPAIGHGNLQAPAGAETLRQAIGVHDGDAIMMTQALKLQAGLSVGISSGANLVAAIRLQQSLPVVKAVVTIFFDDQQRYNRAALTGMGETQEDWITPDTELLGQRLLAKI